MRILISILFAFCFHAQSAVAQTEIKSVLILGDSYLKGHFGEFLQKKFHEEGKYDVLSIAIGGAGSRTFSRTMRNQCCGYRVRKICAGEALKDSTKKWGAVVPVVESSERVTGEIVMKEFGGDLRSVINDWKPDAIILVLGANYLNAHDELLKIIYSYNENIPLIWVGPFDKKASSGRYALIKNVLKNKSNCILVKSDSILNKLGIEDSHFYGKTAMKVVNTLFSAIEPFLNKSLHIEKTASVPH
ncbi:MAG: hypothetical protein V2A54_05015 [Bacteroidota bacterium]